MQFNSVDFLIFFPAVVAVYFIVPKKARLYWLLIASYYFYMSWNALYALLIASSTLITWAGGLLCARFSGRDTGGRVGHADDRVTASENTSETAEKAVSGSHHADSQKVVSRDRHSGKRKTVLWICILINLGILALFKYGNFAIESLNRLLLTLHMQQIGTRFSFLLPVGISFYTFQALGYLIDVYRGDVEAEKNPFRYALFVSFFPQLVAGPIERSKNLLSQMRNLENLKLWNARRIAAGAVLMVWGLFMKMVIADRVSILADTVFDNFGMSGGTELLFGAIAFALQIYCDFGSYSLIAIGAAKILGFDLMENFRAPYFATGIRDFWSRWHISLSTWFRDYLYIPLGGNRRGAARKALNLMVVFLVSGLWHGASWNFVIWGGVHGLLQVFGNALKPLRKKVISALKIRTECFSWRLLQTLGTFLLVTLTWVFFRSPTLSDSLHYLGRIFTRWDPWVLSGETLYTLGLSRPEMNILLLSLLLLFLVDLLRERKGLTLDAWLETQNLYFRFAVIIGLVLLILIFGEYGPTFDAKQFIYFQF